MPPKLTKFICNFNLSVTTISVIMTRSYVIDIEKLIDIKAKSFKPYIIKLTSELRNSTL